MLQLSQRCSTFSLMICRFHEIPRGIEQVAKRHLANMH